MSDPLEALTALIDAVSPHANVVLLGGLAANVHRPIQRLTVDVDALVVGAGIGSPSAIERVLLRRGFQRPPGKRAYRVGRFEWRRLLWPGNDPLAPVVVDLFFVERGFLAEVANRALRIRLDVLGSPREILVATAEDLVVFKLLAIASGREVRGHKILTDADDVRSILSTRSNSIDVAYIRTRAADLGALRLANRFLREAGFR